MINDTRTSFKCVMTRSVIIIWALLANAGVNAFVQVDPDHHDIFGEYNYDNYGLEDEM
jgi:hypothetical protein